MEGKNLNKFTKLNFNLKNEIFEFLTAKEILKEIIIINKAFKYALKSKKVFIYFFENIDILTQKISMKNKAIENIKKEFSVIVNNENLINEICSILLTYKNKNKYFISFQDNDLISNFNIFTQFIQLKNNLIKLDLNVKDLAMNLNYLKLINFAIRDNKNLLVLSLKKIGLGKVQESMKIISECLCQNPRIEILDLSENELCRFKDDHEYLSKIIKSNKGLKELNLAMNFRIFYDEENFQTNEDLVTSNRQIDFYSQESFHFARFRSLYRSESHNSNNSFIYFNNSLSEIEKNDSIIDEKKIFSYENFLEFCESLKNSNSITYLNLSHCLLKASTELFELFFNTLADNISLKCLILDNNRLDLGKNKCLALRNFLEKNKTLERFSINDNFISTKNEVMENIFNGILVNNSLVNLSLNENNIFVHDVNQKNQELLSDLVKNRNKEKKLKYLNLKNNNSRNYKFLEKIKRSIIKNNNLNETHINENDTNSFFRYLY